MENITTPFNPLMALGDCILQKSLFFSILEHPYASDPTIQHLYASTLYLNQIDSQKYEQFGIEADLQSDYWI